MCLTTLLARTFAQGHHISHCSIWRTSHYGWAIYILQAIVKLLHFSYYVVFDWEEWLLYCFVYSDSEFTTCGDCVCLNPMRSCIFPSADWRRHWLHGYRFYFTLQVSVDSWGVVNHGSCQTGILLSATSVSMVNDFISINLTRLVSRNRLWRSCNTKYELENTIVDACSRYGVPNHINGIYVCHVNELVAYWR